MLFMQQKEFSAKEKEIALKKMTKNKENQEKIVSAVRN